VQGRGGTGELRYPVPRRVVRAKRQLIGSQLIA
jgi:hypothetical protein